MSDSTGRHTGLIGLAVMGENLALNIERNGFPLAVYNRTAARTEEFLTERAQGRNIVAGFTVEEFAQLMERPRRIIIMVKAGAPIDAVLAELRPHLDPDDIVIDGGNSLYTDTARRTGEMEGAFRFMGMGISGGEEGALNGPSLMPGGPRDAYDIIEPMLVAISAKTEAGPCVTYIGPGGAGHYVKMVHNGIEYGDMQLIAETYDIMRRVLKMSAAEMAKTFACWDQGMLESFLIEITAQVLAIADSETGNPLVDMVLDTAEQKGTGRWTSMSALDLATPIPTIDAAVIARIMSSKHEQRKDASELLTTGTNDAFSGDREAIVDDLERALYVAKISSYAQGMALLQAASQFYSWDLNLAEIARIWKGGCIIRAALLDPIRQAFSDETDLLNLLMAPHIAELVNGSVSPARRVIAAAVRAGIPSPALSASLNYIDTFRTERLPANLIQALRDNFGAHTYQRLDKPGIYHTDWMTGETEQLL